MYMYVHYLLLILNKKPGFADKEPSLKLNVLSK